MKRFLNAAAVALVAAAFFASGATKFAGAPPVVEIFARFGLPGWFMLVTGAVEIVGALGLIAPARRARFFGAMLLCPTMIVGAGFHFAFDPLSAAIPAILLACATAAITARNAGAPVTGGPKGAQF